MIDVILFVTASTLSGSLLLLLIETAGRFFETKSGPGKIYLLLKISLLYFCIPIVFLALFLAGMYTYEPNLMPHEELDGFYTLNYFTDLAMERLFVRTPPWIQFLFGIWIAGAVSIGAGRSLYKRVQLRRLLENCTRLEDGRVMEAARSAALHVSIRKGISLYQCPQIAGPFLYGVFRPQMVVPERELAQEEWEPIFLHEFTHYQNKDTFYRQLVEVILWIHWFNPLIYRFSHLFRDYGELACDEKSRIAYSNNAKHRE
ncbi:MAG TPA: M56 family metallopeptidase [Candidatus Caccovicinus merdipullorum]|uniref:M56 family metallopeptidase n=1 Tax=Candidatus Caccovicinus merdipullorum TaxID=2840724 RepID=A0A9D1GIK8_9FIRM|nr:M56 family metallopeptidase [Candidatus Caccovicinus merdipullorum]